MSDTVNYQGTPFTICYIDPTASSTGRVIDGTTPATAFVDFPSSFTDKTMYVIRRTADTVEDTKYAMINNSWSSDNIFNLAILGMPKSTDMLYKYMPSSVVTAWGGDEAEYANLAVENNVVSQGVVLNNLQKITFNRVYLFRTQATKTRFSNPTSFGPMFFSNNVASYYFSNCKFGYKDFNINDPDWLDSFDDLNFVDNYAFAGNYIKTAGKLSIDNSIINSYYRESGSYGTTANNDYTKGFISRDGLILFNNNIYMMSNAYSQSSSDGNATFYSTSNIKLSNNTVHCVPNNNTNLNYYFLCNYQKNYDCQTFIRDLTFKKMNFTKKDQYTKSWMAAPFLWSTTSAFDVNNIDVDWSEESNQLNLGYYGLCFKSATSTKFKNNCIKNITFKGVQSTYDYNGSYYTPLYVDGADFTLTNYYRDMINYYSTIKLSGIDIISGNNINNCLILLNCCNLTDGYFEGGRVALDKNCYFKCRKIKSGLNSIAIETMSYNNYINVDEIEIDKDDSFNSATSAYANLVGYILGGNNVIINKCNVKPFDFTLSSSANATDGKVQWVALDYNGKFVERNDTAIAQSWSAKRIGSTSPSSIRLTNTAALSVNNVLNVGGELNNGFEVSATKLGNSYIDVYFAYYNDMQDTYNIDQKILVDVLVPKDVEGKTIYESYPSDVYGEILDDNSTWEGDNAVISKKFRINIPVSTLTKAIQVKFKYSWSDAVGYVYIDPDIKLIKA